MKIYLIDIILILLFFNMALLPDQSNQINQLSNSLSISGKTYELEYEAENQETKTPVQHYEEFYMTPKYLLQGIYGSFGVPFGILNLPDTKGSCLFKFKITENTYEFLNNQTQFEEVIIVSYEKLDDVNKCNGDYVYDELIAFALELHSDPLPNNARLTESSYDIYNFEISCTLTQGAVGIV